MVKITETQECAIKYSRYNSLGDSFYCERVDNLASTLNALIRKGLVAKPRGAGFPYWLTDAGERMRKELNKIPDDVCINCQQKPDGKTTECNHCG